MAIDLVRKPSETPNINNFDDYRMFRYATGGYNGVVEKYGNECDYEISGSDFKIKSGEIVIDGVQARIDANGKTITVDSIVGTQYYSIYCEINLSLVDNQKVEIKSSYDTATYPIIDNGDDLTENQIGIARLELYRFTANSGVISTVARRFNLIEIGQVKKSEIAVQASKSVTQDISDNSINIATTAFVHNLLDFKQDNIMYEGNIVGQITRVAGYVSGHLDIYSITMTSGIPLLIPIPNDYMYSAVFLPNGNVINYKQLFGFEFNCSSGSVGSQIVLVELIFQNNQTFLKIYFDSYNGTFHNIYFGYKQNEEITYS